jgi:hypothetical protein
LAGAFRDGTGSNAACAVGNSTTARINFQSLVLVSAGGTAPYAPDFNPIEQPFAKLKTLLRKAAEPSVDGSWNRIAIVRDAFTPDECANDFRNAGYASCQVDNALARRLRPPASE